MCDHSCFVHSSYYTEICTGCGLERQIPYTPNCYDVGYNAPLRVSCYSRNKRFETQLDCIIKPLTAPFPKSKTLYLLGRQAPYQSVSALVNALKGIPGPKSYTHLHLYCIKFLAGYKPPRTVSKLMRYDMVSFFMKVECAFRSSEHKTFFSYPWLLTKFLSLFGLAEHLAYVKNISCRKRASKYESLWKELTLDVMFEEFGVLGE